MTPLVLLVFLVAADAPICPRFAGDVRREDASTSDRAIRAATALWGPLRRVRLRDAAYAASSERRAGGRRHQASWAFDGVPSTAWVEGDAGSEGAWVEVDFASDQTPDPWQAVLVRAGVRRHAAALRNPGRPAEVRLELRCGAAEVTCRLQLADVAAPQIFRLLTPLAPAERCRVRLTLEREHAGERVDDAGLAEVELLAGPRERASSP